MIVENEKLQQYLKKIDPYFKSLTNVKLFLVSLDENLEGKFFSSSLKFEYISKKNKKYMFDICFEFVENEFYVFGPIFSSKIKTTFELRVIFSKIVDLFLDVVLPEQYPSLYIKIMHVRVDYPDEYLKINER